MMNNKNNILEAHPAYKIARDAYGLNFELNQLIEECAEIIVAVNKFKRSSNDRYHTNLVHLFEEIGDVENLFQQMKFWFPNMTESCNTSRLEKLNRLQKMIEEGSK